MRTVRMEDGSDWYVAADIGELLGLSNVRMSVVDLDAADHKVVPVPTKNGGFRDMIVISSIGAIVLAARSKHPSGRSFLTQTLRLAQEAAPIPFVPPSWVRDYGGQIDRFAQENVLTALKLLGVTVARDAHVAPLARGRLLNRRDRGRNRHRYVLGMRGYDALLLDATTRRELRREMKIRLGFDPYPYTFDEVVDREGNLNAYDPETGELRREGAAVTGSNVLRLEDGARSRVKRLTTE